MIKYNNVEFVAKTHYGLEELLANELNQLGAKEITIINRAVKFKGNKELLYKSNLWLRTAVNVLVPISSFKIRNQHDLYEKVKQLDWLSYFDNNQTFSIHSSVHSDLFQHTQFPALKAKDAIVDKFREATGTRPSIDTKFADIRINLHISNNLCNISLDSSGKTLNKRGYRVGEIKAPINEVLAAGIIKLTNWQPSSPLFDPMCGSATFSIEAALSANNIAPGLINPKYAFQNWKDYNPELFEKVIIDAKKEKIDAPSKIMASDIDQRVLRNTTKNIFQANLNKKIQLTDYNFFNLKPEKGSTIILNPPYDVRLRSENINQLYRKIGDALKQNCSGCTAWIISSNDEAIKNIGLRPSKKYNLFNGKLPSKLLRFDLYEGSKKSKFNR